MKKYQIIAIVGSLAIFLSALLVQRLTAAGGLSQNTNGNKNAPRAVFPETIHDVGEVEAGTDISYAFKVKNTGQAELRIDQVKPG